MYDNHSTDNSVDLAKQLGFDVVPFGTPGVLSDADYLQVKNNCWKGCKSDWVIIGDADEFVHNIYSPKLFPLPKEILTPRAYDMYSFSLPTHSLFEKNWGIRNEKYDKPMLFCPHTVQEINYVPGCHRANPVGDDVRIAGVQGLYMLHYRFIGGPRRTLERYNVYKTRLSKQNIENRWGTQYLKSDAQIVEEWNTNFNKAQPVL